MRLLCRELLREPGVDLLLLTKRGSELMRRCYAAGVPVHGVPWTMGLDPRAWWSLRRLVRSFRPDLIHVHDSHALMLARAAMGSARPRALLAQRRVDFHVGRRSGWLRATHIIAVSAAVKAILVADGARAADVSVIPDGIDPDEVRAAAAAPLGIRARLGLPAGTPLAVNVAALVDHKDQRTLIHAAQEARAAAPGLHWAIAGEGPLRRSLAAEIARLGLDDRVHLLGYIDRADALIREGDVFVMSSKEEGMGSVVLHALALGKPIVATRAGGLPEVVPGEGLVPVGDAAALAQKVSRTLTNPHSAVRKPQFPERFTARAMAQAVLACYHRLT